MNLFEFYRDVALRYQEECLGCPMTPRRSRELDEKLAEVQASYFGCPPPTYVNPTALVAYTLHFAPKHAVIWRQLAASFTWDEEPAPGFEWKVNSIGTGPGSEVFGMLCGLPGPQDMTASVVGLEIADVWRDVFDIAIDEFNQRSTRTVTGFLTNDASNLHAEGDVVGSLVLSEEAKRGGIVKLIENVRDNTNAKTALFLDYNYKIGPTEETKRWLKDPIVEAGFPCWDERIKDAEALALILQAEADGCSPLYCARSFNHVQPFNFYRVKLR